MKLLLSTEAVDYVNMRKEQEMASINRECDPMIQSLNDEMIASEVVSVVRHWRENARSRNSV